ncbi:hypothetical protein [Microbacterium karelineae]|uniref:hypothetical protein n=1 Tax=Microbacterium karelineae TaxID=2654283 RepID=UPI0012E9DAB8|nr:hypothetical protein [Microbacterium karelineae]
MNPLDLMLWALAFLVVAIVAAITIALAVGLCNTIRGRRRREETRREIYKGRGA